jgi:hypothetical protein
MKSKGTIMFKLIWNYKLVLRFILMISFMGCEFSPAVVQQGVFRFGISPLIIFWFLISKRSILIALLTILLTANNRITKHTVAKRKRTSNNLKNITQNTKD